MVDGKSKENVSREEAEKILCILGNRNIKTCHDLAEVIFPVFEESWDKAVMLRTTLEAMGTRSVIHNSDDVDIKCEMGEEEYCYLVAKMDEEFSYKSTFVWFDENGSLREGAESDMAESIMAKVHRKEMIAALASIIASKAVWMLVQSVAETLYSRPSSRASIIIMEP